MLKRLPILLALFATALFARTILVQDFEDTSMFTTGAGQLNQIGLSKEPYGNWLGMNGQDFKIVEGASPAGGKQVLQLSRVNVGKSLSAFRTIDLRDDCDTTVRVTFRPPAVGQCHFGFTLNNSFQNKKVAQIQITDENIFCSVVNGHGNFLGRYLPEQWQTLVVTVHPGADKLDAHFIRADGTFSKCVDAPLQENLPFNQIVFYNCPDSPLPALIDTVEIEQGDHASIHGRENVALSASDSTAVVRDRKGESDGARLLDGDAGSQSIVNASGLPATVEVTFGEPRTISTVRILSGVALYKDFPSGDLSLTSCVIEGNSTASGTWRVLADESAGAPVAKDSGEDDATRAWQFDFPAIEVKGIRVTLRDSNDPMKRSTGPIDRKEVLLREIEAYDKEFGGAALGLGSVLQAEYRLQGYRYQDTAELHAVLAEGTPSFEVEVSLKERWNGTVPCAPFRFTLKPGLNIIPINIKGWENGEYRTLLRAAGKDAPVKGELARLLRLDRIEAAVPPARFADMSGKRLYFPDAWYLEKHNGLEFKMFQPDVHYLDFPRISDPKAYVKLGSTMYWLKDGRLVISFGEYDYEWRNVGKHYAACTPGKWDWTLVEAPKDDEIAMTDGAELSRLKGTQGFTGGFLPGGSLGNQGNYRMYDPEKDGPVDLRNLRVQYVGYKPLDWGCVKVPAQSTWLLWKKGDEFVVLQDHPFLQDGVSDLGGFEGLSDTNDNHAGQWLSADGKTLYFVRGHLLRRYPPFIDRYDNLWPVSRILTIFSTQDGLNWNRHYYSLPDETDPPNMQHYGSSLYHAPKGNDLMLGFMSPYNAHTQQYDVEITWSWNGEEWKRFEGHPRWIPNSTVPDKPAFGIINIHDHIIEKDGVIYHEIGWATNVPHFAGDNTNAPGRGGLLTGEEIRKTNEKRGVSTSWPYWSHYGSWDKLAESWNTVTSTCGVAVYRKGGLFGAVAGKNVASFVTRPMSAKGKLTANLKVNDGGSAKFSLLDKDGKVIATKELVGDGVALPVFDTLPDGDFRIAAELQDAVLYTLNFE